jgi:hypothetical protein
MWQPLSAKQAGRQAVGQEAAGFAAAAQTLFS